MGHIARTHLPVDRAVGDLPDLMSLAPWRLGPAVQGRLRELGPTDGRSIFDVVATASSAGVFSHQADERPDHGRVRSSVRNQLTHAYAADHATVWEPLERRPRRGAPAQALLEGGVSQRSGALRTRTFASLARSCLGHEHLSFPSRARDTPLPHPVSPRDVPRTRHRSPQVGPSNDVPAARLRVRLLCRVSPTSGLRPRYT